MHGSIRTSARLGAHEYHARPDRATRCLDGMSQRTDEHATVFHVEHVSGGRAPQWRITHNAHYVKCTLLVRSVEDAFAIGHVDPRLNRRPVRGGVGCCPVEPRGVGVGQVGEGWGEGEIGRLRKFVYRTARNFANFSKRVVILMTIVPPSGSIFIIGPDYFIVIHTDYFIVIRPNNEIVLSLKIFIFSALL